MIHSVLPYWVYMNEQELIIQNQTSIPRRPSAYFWYVSKPFKRWMFIAMLFVIIGASASGGASYFFKLIVDAVEANNHQAALKYALLYPVVIFLVQMSYRVSGFFGRKWAVHTNKYNYDLLTQHTMKHSHSYFTNRFAGSLLSKVTNVTSAVDHLIPEILWTHLSSLVQLLVTIGFLVVVDVPAALVFVALIFVLIYFNRSMSTEKAKRSRAAAAANTVLRARIVDVITNVQAVRQYVRTKHEEQKIDELSTDVKETNNLSWGHTEKMLIWNGVILFCFSLAMFWILVAGWETGSVSTGELVLILALYSQITGTLTFIGRAFNSTARTIGELEEGLEELLVPFEITDMPEAKPLQIKSANIDWDDVMFKFDGNQVFSGFNLNIMAGQRLGLVGRSGAGKTTFVSLLLRQHDLQGGSISIDGQNIAEVTQNSLRRSIAIVPQEPALFHRSIFDNIIYGKPEASKEEVIEVAKKAQAHDFIMKLPEGYGTMVGERGVKLSGGQKQRVAIARAMLKDAPILVLDEATSALDSESEVAIQKALENLMEGRTVIAIAHRLSTLRKMDRIVVLEEGNIIEDGTHESLTQSGGMYERLWNHQAGGFLKD